MTYGGVLRGLRLSTMYGALGNGYTGAGGGVWAGQSKAETEGGRG